MDWTRYKAHLARRVGQQALRRLQLPLPQAEDLASNDYLGLARLSTGLGEEEGLARGSGGSRLLSGHSPWHEALEADLALWHQAPKALLCNSGYEANLALFSTLPAREDVVFADALVHASIHDGLKLGKAQVVFFAHNDLADLAEKLRQTPCKGQAWIAVESVYSMDGDLAPLSELADLAEAHGAELIVDEAHATGVLGPLGMGLVQALGLEQRIALRMHTFGKALGAHGAVILCPELIYDYLINFARPLIYSTTLPPIALEAVRQSYLFLRSEAGQAERRALQANILLAQQLLGGAEAYQGSPSAIQIWRVADNASGLALVQQLAQAHLDLRLIRYPTVARGTERLRICLHSFNTREGLQRLAKCLLKA